MVFSIRARKGLTVASAIVGLILVALILTACGGGGDSGDDYAARLRGDPTATPAPTAAPAAQIAAPQVATPAPTVVVLAAIPTAEPPPTMAPPPTPLPTTTPYVPTAAPAQGVCHYEWRGDVRVAIFCPEGVQP